MEEFLFTVYLFLFFVQHWILFPPANAFYSTTPARKLFEDKLPVSLEGKSECESGSDEEGGEGRGLGGRAIRVVQRAGDVLYVPALWGHATLNTAQSIGVAHEFTVESFCME